MSTITYLDDDYLEGDRELPDEEALVVFHDNPQAALDLIYGPERRVENACPAHDHEEDGGESLLLPILSHSFGRFNDGTTEGVGIPLGASLPEFVSLPEFDFPGSFAPETSDGITDYTNGKRLYCAAVVVPGGVLGVRVSIVEWHQTADLETTLTLALRSLSHVNYQLGVTSQASVDLAYTTEGDEAYGVHSAEIVDLSHLGDPTLDRVLEVSLWLTSDVEDSEGNEQRICALEILPRYFTPTARAATTKDIAFPALSVRELKGDLGTFSGQLAAKIRESYNGLNRALWGATPGLGPDLLPDRRLPYQRTIEASHQHQGIIVPDGSGGIFSDGACLKDAQSFGFVGDLGLNTDTPPKMTHSPNGGALLHVTDLSTQWDHFNFRRSIPAGCGALVLVVAVAPGYTSLDELDPSRKLLVEVVITPVAGGDSIVSRVLSGPYTSPLESTDPEFGLCEVEPVDDVAYRTNASLLAAGKKGWNRSAEIDDPDKRALQLNYPQGAIETTALYRYGVLRVELTYPPERPTEEAHETTDYDVKLRFILRDSDGTVDNAAQCIWILCYTAPGY